MRMHCSFQPGDSRYLTRLPGASNFTSQSRGPPHCPARRAKVGRPIPPLIDEWRRGSRHVTPLPAGSFKPSIQIFREVVAGASEFISHAARSARDGTVLLHPARKTFHPRAYRSQSCIDTTWKFPRRFAGEIAPPRSWNSGPHRPAPIGRGWPRGINPSTTARPTLPM